MLTVPPGLQACCATGAGQAQADGLRAASRGEQHVSASQIDAYLCSDAGLHPGTCLSLLYSCQIALHQFLCSVHSGAVVGPARGQFNSPLTAGIELPVISVDADCGSHPGRSPVGCGHEWPHQQCDLPGMDAGNRAAGCLPHERVV